jgi:hypothetical protein
VRRCILARTPSAWDLRRVNFALLFAEPSDVALIATAVPDPSTYALLVGTGAV